MFEEAVKQSNFSWTEREIAACRAYDLATTKLAGQPTTKPEYGSDIGRVEFTLPSGRKAQIEEQMFLDTEVDKRGLIIHTRVCIARDLDDDVTPFAVSPDIRLWKDVSRNQMDSRIDVRAPFSLRRRYRGETEKRGYPWMQNVGAFPGESLESALALIELPEEDVKVIRQWIDTLAAAKRQCV